MKPELKPTKVRKIFCPICKELMVKIYPWSTITLPEGVSFPGCKKCQSKELAKKDAAKAKLRKKYPSLYG
jgi:hypothetical protein